MACRNALADRRAEFIESFAPEMFDVDSPVTHRVGPATCAFLGERVHRLFVGKWVDGTVDIGRAVRAGRVAFQGQRSRQSGFRRTRFIRRLSNLIEANLPTFAELEVLDNGVAIVPAETTSVHVALMWDYYADRAGRIEGTTPAPPAFVGEALTYTTRLVAGVVSQLVPWNVPLSTICLTLAPGCTVVLMPDEETPPSGPLLDKLIQQAGFPSGIVYFVNDRGDIVGAALVAHSEVDTISFTGADDVGKRTIRAAADALNKISLQLGGKSQVMVLGDVDCDLAIPDIAAAPFVIQTTNCMAGTRIFVHDSMHTGLIDGLFAHTGATRLDHVFDPANDVGPLIYSQQLSRIEDCTADGLANGATLVAGGKVRPGPGNFIMPTAFTDIRCAFRIVCKDNFGSVTTIQRFTDNDLDSLASEANNSLFRLSGGVWTRHLSSAHRRVARIRSSRRGPSKYPLPRLLPVRLWSRNRTRGRGDIPQNQGHHGKAVRKKQA
jgi:phenylacetaldehyde dehydrogenase